MQITISSLLNAFRNYAIDKLLTSISNSHEEENIGRFSRARNGNAGPIYPIFGGLSAGGATENATFVIQVLFLDLEKFRAKITYYSRGIEQLLIPTIQREIKPVLHCTLQHYKRAVALLMGSIS